MITKSKTTKMQFRFAAKCKSDLLQNAITFCSKTKLCFAAKQKTASEGIVEGVFCKTKENSAK